MQSQGGGELIAAALVFFGQIGKSGVQWRAGPSAKTANQAKTMQGTAENPYIPTQTVCFPVDSLPHLQYNPTLQAGRCDDPWGCKMGIGMTAEEKRTTIACFETDYPDTGAKLAENALKRAISVQSVGTLPSESMKFWTFPVIFLLTTPTFME